MYFLVVIIIIVFADIFVQYLYLFWLYKLGQYVKIHYPDRYQKQLVPPNSGNNQRPFPSNLSWMGYHSSMGNTGPLRNIENIAEAEKDEYLSSKAKFISKMQDLLSISLIIFIFIVLIGVAVLYNKI
ncbi:MAG TPA: hypothetical protein VF974_02935 [Patescibacteria group bacterium]